MISYAYNHEDVLLRRVFPESTGFFVDIGAHHPVVDSVTKHFSDRGWRGINVEPIPNRATLFQHQRPHDINISAGISDRSGTMTFHEIVDGATLSTFSDELAAEYRAKGYTIADHNLPVLTLTELFDRHVRETIDFLSIDVEGHEQQVLQGADFKKWRPRLVVIESTRPGSPTPSHDAWESILLNAEYHFATFDGVNRYYVRSEDVLLSTMLEVPVNAFDNFTPIEQHLMAQELNRYRAINPMRRLGVWLSDVCAALRRKIAKPRTKQ